MSYDVTLLPRDGIEPEVTEANLRVLDEVPVEFNWDRHRIIGTEAVEQNRPVLPEDVIESIKRSNVVRYSNSRGQRFCHES